MIYTSYFGNYRNIPENLVKVSIALYPPKNWDGLREPLLTPSEEILWKGKHGDTETAAREFREYLDSFDVDYIIEQLDDMTDFEDYVLLCYEKPDDFCHRHIVREWLRENGYECEELGRTDL